VAQAGLTAGVIPTQHPVDEVDVLVGKLREHMAQLGIRIEPVELGRAISEQMAAAGSLLLSALANR